MINNQKPVNLIPHRALKKGETVLGFADTKHGIKYRFVMDKKRNRFFIPAAPLKEQPKNEISD